MAAPGARRTIRDRAALAWMFGAIVALVGCAEERVIERTIALRLPDAASCVPVSSLAALRLRALGDGPGDPAAMLALSPDRAIRELPATSGYPTLAILAIAEAPGWRGVGWRLTDAAGDEITLLPATRSCPIGDPETRAAPGGMIALLRDGTLFLAGGLDDDGRATAQATLLAPGAQVGAPAASRLALPSAFGTATALDDGRVLLVGGAIAASAPAYDQLEILDPRTEGARVIEELEVPRRDHSALRLRDGRVLLAGGRASDGGAALDSLEVIDPSGRASALLPAGLSVARIAPHLALAEDGTVWVAGGAERAPLERVDVEAGSIERFDGLEEELPPPLAIATLDGDRLAWIGASEVYVVALHGERPMASRVLDAPAIESARVAVTGGRILVGGAASGARLAYLLDPGTGRVLPRESSRVPLALATMSDGTVVELGASGASLRREDAPTPFDDPPATLLFASDDDAWVRDPTGAERWSEPRFDIRDGALIALAEGARVDVRALRGSRFDVVLTARGAVALRIVEERGPAITIAIDDASITLGECRAERAPGAPATIEIAPGRVTLAGRECAVATEGRVGLAFVAREVGAALERVSITRR